MTGMVVVVVIEPVALTTRVTKVSASPSMTLASPLVGQPPRRSAFEKALSNRRCCFARQMALTARAFLAAAAKHSRLPSASLPAAICLAAAQRPALSAAHPAPDGEPSTKRMLMITRT